MHFKNFRGWGKAEILILSHCLLVQEEDLPPVQDEDILLAQEEDLLPGQEEDLLLGQE